MNAVEALATLAEDDEAIAARIGERFGIPGDEASLALRRAAEQDETSHVTLAGKRVHIHPSCIAAYNLHRRDATLIHPTARWWILRGLTKRALQFWVYRVSLVEANRRGVLPEDWAPYAAYAAQAWYEQGQIGFGDGNIGNITLTAGWSQGGWMAVNSRRDRIQFLRSYANSLSGDPRDPSTGVPQSTVDGVDVMRRAMAIAEARFPGRFRSQLRFMQAWYVTGSTDIASRVGARTTEYRAEKEFVDDCLTLLTNPSTPRDAEVIGAVISGTSVPVTRPVQARAVLAGANLGPYPRRNGSAYRWV